MEVYILIDNKPQGPYTRELVQRHLKSGQFKATDLAAYAGSSDWQPLSVMMQSWGGATPSSSTKGKPTAVILTVVVFLLVVVGATFWILRNKLAAIGKDKSAKTESAPIAQIEDDGYPKTLAELDAWYVEPPEGQNAASYFFKGAAAIQITNEDYYSQSLPLLGQSQFPIGKRLSLDQKKSITDFVRKNELAWKILQEGARYEQARYPVDLKQGEETLFYHPAKIRLAVELGELRAALFAVNKQPQLAVDTFLVSLAMAQSMKDEPVNISQLIRSSLFSNQKDSLEFIFNSVAVSSADLERLSVALAKVEAQDAEGVPFTRAFAGERVLVLDGFDEPPDKLKKEIEELQRAGFEGWTNRTPSELMTNLPALRAFLSETFARALAMRKEPLPERLKIEKYARSRADEAKTKQIYLGEALLTGWGNSVQREAEGVANVRVMQTAVALEQFRQVNRKYPDSLSELVPKFLPEVPADPFKGEALVYRNFPGYELRCTGSTNTTIRFEVGNPPK